MRTLGFLLFLSLLTPILCYSADADCAYIEVRVNKNGQPQQGVCVQFQRVSPTPYKYKSVITDSNGDAKVNMQYWPTNCQPCCPSDNTGTYKYTVYTYYHAGEEFYYDGTIEEIIANFTDPSERDGCPETSK